MNTLEKLLSRRWFVKAKDKEEYYQIKDDIGRMKLFLSEKLGYHAIVNPYVIKLEKIPAVPENWMGILEFNDKIEYIFLCLILMFLEEKEIEDQFVLSQLTEYMQSQWKQEELDWTLYKNRRCLVKVLKYCVDCGILQVNDGDEDGFRSDAQAEVLYLNTGISRYFMKNFTRDISGYMHPSDFEREEWVGLDEDRGIIRRQRVYRRLLMSMGIYRNAETEEDFLYVRNYRNVIQSELSQYFDCELQVYRNSAFLVLGEECSMGRCFPEGNSRSDITLLCSSLIWEKINSGKLECPIEENISMSKDAFIQILEECKERHQKGFLKTYREKTTKEFCDDIIQYMKELEFITEKDGQFEIHSGLCRATGRYPENFVGEAYEE